MSVKVKMNSTTHELLEAEDNQLQLLGQTASTVWQTFTFPNGHTIWDYEYLILTCGPSAYSRIFNTVYIPIIEAQEIPPMFNGTSNNDKSIACKYGESSNYLSEFAYNATKQFNLKVNYATYSLARLFGKLKSGGVLKLLKSLDWGYCL